ncbi:MAG: hypothetical protein ABJP45_03985 [Cyclobacteriaceae bacterium]
MKIGIIVLCRFNSSRLPGKILKEIEGKYVLTYILERLENSDYSEGVVVATSTSASDDPIAEYCQKNSINLFRGSLENVSDRFAQCAKQNDFEYAVRVNGDNLFTDARLVDQGVEIAVDGQYDFVSNVNNRTYPTGMSVEVVKTSFYLNLLDSFDSPTYREHVTSWLYEHPDSGLYKYFYNESMVAAHGLKLALDCEEDLNFVSLLLRNMDKPHTEYSWQEIVKLVANE